MNILSNVTIVDWTSNVAGPYCTQILGDLGANVIKIERSGAGDDSRHWSPPAWNGEATTFLAFNRNKKSVCLDLNNPKGQEILIKLVKKADIFIHSLKPGSAEGRGFGYEKLSDLNPSLIYCAISAFGEVGPLKTYPGYDPLIQGYSGIMSVTGNPGDEPARVGVSMIDMSTGVWAAMGILSSIIQRMQTGKGMKVNTSLLETGVAWMNLPLTHYMATKIIPKKIGTATAMVAPYEAFKTNDGWILIAAGNNRLFNNLCDILDLQELTDDERFSTNNARIKNRDLLHQLIEIKCLDYGTEQLIRMLSGRVPCSPINDTEKVYDDEQVKALQIIKEIKGTRIEDFKIVDLPFQINNERGTFRFQPPLLGEHTVDTLTEIGYSSEEIESLKENKVIQ
jgi:crotonobetainyl-CoA:carnitine CoA-transferase CaiB-like acyl-CoA transferase